MLLGQGSCQLVRSVSTGVARSQVFTIAPPSLPIFPVEKILDVDQCHNRQNVHRLCAHSSEVPFMAHTKTKHPAGIMVLHVIGSLGKEMPPTLSLSGLRESTRPCTSQHFLGRTSSTLSWKNSNFGMITLNSKTGPLDTLPKCASGWQAT